MAYRTFDGARLKEDQRPASATFSRLLVLAYLVAILLALAAGVLWMSWHLIARWLSF